MLSACTTYVRFMGGVYVPPIRVAPDTVQMSCDLGKGGSVSFVTRLRQSFVEGVQRTAQISTDEVQLSNDNNIPEKGSLYRT
jgi:hypothetical protein